MELSKRLCFCMDVTTGSVLAGIYTTALSVIFIGIGVENLVLEDRLSVFGQDVVTLTSTYGLLVALSVLYAISSIALVLGAASKKQLYLLPWLLLTPLWSTCLLIVLIVLPLELPHAIKLSDPPSRLTGTIIVYILNVLSMVCVSMLLHIFRTTPRHLLKSLGVAQTLSTGFQDAGQRIRQSMRRKKKPAISYTRNESSNTVRVTIPQLSMSAPSSIVLQPRSLEVVRSEKSQAKAKSAAATSRREADSDDPSAVDCDDMDISLTTSQQLGSMDKTPGLDNPAFSTIDE